MFPSITETPSSYLKILWGLLLQIYRNSVFKHYDEVHELVFPSIVPPPSENGEHEVCNDDPFFVRELITRFFSFLSVITKAKRL